MFRMTKKALLCCMLAMTLLLSSCALVVKDQAVDNATPIVTVGEKVYTKAEVKQMVDVYLGQMANQYASQYNYNLDTKDSSVIAAAQDAVINILVEQAVLDKKTEELGAQLNEEEKADVQSLYDSYFELVSGMIGDHEHGEDEAELHKQEVDYVMASYFGVSLESLTEEKVQEKLKGIVTADVAVTDDDVKAVYDAKVEAAKNNYAAAPNGYGTAVNNGTTVYYRPAGYRMVKNLLVQYSTECQDAIAAMNSKASEQTAIVNEKKAAIEAIEGADLEALLAKTTATVAAPAEEAALATATELTAEVADTFEADTDEALKTLVKEYAAAKALADAYTAKAQELTDAAYASIDARADEALAKLDAGEDWDAVMAAYTDDPGMKEGRATAVTGYAVREGFTSFDSAFVEAAMGLANVGDHTGKVKGTSSGYYIIQYTSEVQEGPVALEDVIDTVKAEALSTKKDAVYNETVQQWISAAGAVIDRNALNN